jgi:lysophospholipase L1-like esterase
MTINKTIRRVKPGMAIIEKTSRMWYYRFHQPEAHKSALNFQKQMAKTYTVLCIGDSHTAGFPSYDPLMGGNPESSYQYWLKQELAKTAPDTSWTFMNEGMCGDTARGIVMRLQQALNTASFDLIILAGGTNDLGMVAEEQIFNNLRTGYAACREKGIPLIAAGIPPISMAGYATRVTELNSRIKNYTERHPDVVFVDWFAALRDERGFLRDSYDAGDGVHLSVAGYKSIGRLMAPLIQSLIDQRQT